MKAVRTLGNVEGFEVTACAVALDEGESQDFVVDGNAVVIAGETSDQRVLNAFAAGLSARDVYAVSNISAPFPRRQIPGLPLVKGDDLPTDDAPSLSGDESA